MKKIIGFALCLALLTAFIPTNVGARSEHIVCGPQRWEGEIDWDFLRVVRNDFEMAEKLGCSKLIVHFTSQGGYVLTALMVVAAIRAAKSRGLLIEIHGGRLVASAALFVLAEGTPGYRYAQQDSLVVIHAMSARFGDCLVYPPPEAVSEEDQAIRQLYNMSFRVLARSTGWTVAQVKEWFDCSRSIVGGGEVLILYRLADHMED